MPVVEPGPAVPLIAAADPAAALAASVPAEVAVSIPLPQVTSASVPKELWQPKAELERAFSELKCARIGAEVNLESRSVVLTGHARSAEDKAGLVRKLVSVTGLQEIDGSQLKIVGEPYCRVLQFLARHDIQRSSDQRYDLASVGAAAPGAHTLLSGETLKLVVGGADYDSYLYVDYFSKDGNVVHLLPAEGSDNLVRAKSVIELGSAGRGRRAVAAPPYGVDLVLVIASSRPLLLGSSSVQEPADAYLSSLTRAIDRARSSGSGPRLEYAYHLISIVPRAER